MNSEFAYLAKTIPRWPSLTTYSIQFSEIRPSGSWYFVQHPDNPFSHGFGAYGPHGYGRLRKLRTYPHNEAMGELLCSAGKAKLKMPALQMISLCCGLGGNDIWSIHTSDNLEFEATWCKAGTLHGTDLKTTRLVSQPLGVTKESFLAGDRVYWCTGPGRDWRPSREIEEDWVGNGKQGWFKKLFYGELALGYKGVRF